MAAKGASARPSNLSEEFVHDSSDDSDETGDAAVSPDASKALNGPEKPSTQSQVPNGSKKSSSRPKDPTPDSSESSSESSSPEDDDDGTSSEGPAGSTGSKKRSRESEQSLKNPQPSKKQKTSNANPFTRILAEPFTPPAGFGPLVLDASDYSSGAAEAFSNLSDKQVWYISAPESINISSIKQFNISTAMSGGPIITQDKVSYCLQPTTAPNDALLLPEDADGGYRPSRFKISRGFQLRAIEKAPSGINGPSENPSSGSTADGLRFIAQGSGKPKSPREQPKGLRTHYVPYGVMDGERPAHEGPSSRKADGLVNGASTSTSINRTPSKTKDSAPAAWTGSTASNEAISTDGVSRDSLQKPAQPSPARPSEEGTPKERKKKKKRSKLVDTPSL